MNRKKIVALTMLITMASSNLPVSAEVNQTFEVSTSEQNNNIVNASDLELKTLDKEELNKAIEKAESLNEGDYTKESWTKLQNALRTAKGAQASATSQSAIDYVTKELNDAIAELVEAEEVVVNKSNLQLAVNSVSELIEENYTEASWLELQGKLTVANTILEKVDATQIEVDDATKNLNDAIAALVEVEEEVVGKVELQEAIDRVEVLKANDYTDDSWSNLIQKYETAKVVNYDPTVTQDEINEATKNLNDAIDALVKVIKKEELKNTIESINELVEADYSQISWLNVKLRLTEAKDVMANDKATQAQVDKAKEDLTIAIDGLVKIETAIGKDKLKKVLDLRPTINSKYYTKESWDIYSAQDTKSRLVYMAGNSTEEQVKEATKDLIDALYGLVELTEVADKSSLEATINSVDALVEAEYTEASWLKLQKALSSAKSVFDNENATKSEVDSATANLNAAIRSLVELADIVGKEELVKAIELVESLRSDGYTNSSWANLISVYGKAKAVYYDATATKEVIDEATLNLNNAISDLVILKANGLGDIVSSDQVTVFDTAQFNLELGKKVEKVKVTYFWNENGVEKNYAEYYDVEKNGELVIDRRLVFAREYRVEFTPMIDNVLQVQESKSVNLNVAELEGGGIISLTGNDEIGSTIISSDDSVVTFKIETSLNIDKLEFVFATSNNYTEYYTKNTNAEEVDGKLVWTIRRYLKTDNESHHLQISALSKSEVMDTGTFDVIVTK